MGEKRFFGVLFVFPWFPSWFPLAGGFKYVLEFSPLRLGKWNPIWRSCFSNGLVQPTTRLTSELQHLLKMNFGKWVFGFPEDIFTKHLPFVDFLLNFSLPFCHLASGWSFNHSERWGSGGMDHISSRPHTSDLGPQKVAFLKGNGTDPLFQGNLGWWNIISFDQIHGWKGRSLCC